MIDANGNETSNYAETFRLRAAYKEAHAEVEKLPSDSADERLRRLQREGEAAALLQLAQVHALLAVADEIREFRDRYRTAGAPMGKYGI